MTLRAGLLQWRGGRYLKWGLLLCVASIALYVSQWGEQPQPPNGGTWQGYVLGTLAAALILWLSMLGLRKRSYRSTAGTVQGWTSAHIYLGLALLLVATLHCAAQFGWNVHTLAYVLMCVVIASGLFGLFAYQHYPVVMSANSAGKARRDWLQELQKNEERIQQVARNSDAGIQSMAYSALELTRLGGGVWRQLSARDDSRIVISGSGKASSNTDQTAMIEALSMRIPNTNKSAEADVLNELLALFGRRQVILRVLRRDIRYRGLLRIWLYLHVPLTAALLVALLIHIFSVFIYW